MPVVYIEIKALKTAGDTMPAIATTVRLDPEVKARLAHLSEALHKSQNHLANEAIREYLARRSLEVEADLETTLAKLRAYRETDPDYRRAIADAAAAEVAVPAAEDPAEGRVVADPHLTGSAETEPAESAILDLLED
jgi:predicted transcriptional regulator